MKWGILFIAFTFVLNIQSCEKGKSTPEKSEPIEILLTSGETKVASHGSSIAFTYLANIAQQETIDNKYKNVMISPLSLNFAMAMCWNGADGQTKEQIKNTLGFAGSSDEEVNGYFKKMAETLPKTDPSVKVSIANSIWYDKSFPIQENFNTINKKWFNASVQSLDFGNSNSVNIINNWCSDNTNGMIKKIIDEIEPLEVLFLVNALYFKAPWKNEFKEAKTKLLPFYLRNGSSLSASTMNQEISCPYSEEANYRTATLTYGNGAFNMTIILPNEGLLPEDLYSALNIPANTSTPSNSDISANWDAIVNSKDSVKLDIFLPKFKFEYELEFNNILIKMGIKDAFNPTLANFSKISQEKISISKVLQKTAIDVNEKGSEAAAVTSVSFRVTSVGPNKNEFRVNRPFLFVISEKQTGAILFAGKVENPNL